MKVKLEDIAAKTGYSIATVSRVLTGKAVGRSSSVKIILQAAEDLGYPYIEKIKYPDSQLLSIGFITELFEGEFYSSLFKGFYQASLKTDSEVFFIDVAKRKESIIEYITSLIRHYSGICLFLPEFEKDDYQKILNAIGNYPVISLAPIVNPVIDTVTFDAYLGGHLVAKHFEELGYTDVGIITGPSNKVEALYRKNGFLDYATTSKNLNCVWGYNGDYSVESGYQAYNDLKDRHQSKIAIFGSNDQTCFGFIKKAILDGRKIPDEIAIVGYDDLPFCKLFLPELTSVNTNFYELGKVSIRLLEKKFRGQNDSHGHINLVPVSLSVRTSSQRKR